MSSLDHVLMYISVTLRKAVAPVYQGDELSPFVHSCVEKFEKLEPTSIVKTMESFLKK